MYDEYGHFPIFEHYPNFKEKTNKGWHYTYRSPFLHANVLYSLLNTGMNKSDLIIEKAAKFLMEFREPGNLWRFWANGDAEYPVECGTEDTAICSLVLQKLGFKIRNRNILLSCINEDGSILTWINASYKFLLTRPLSFIWLLAYKKYSKKTVEADMLSYTDAEPVITATVVSYLGEYKPTLKVITYLIEKWHSFSVHDQQFYNKKIIFAFHVARAYKQGCRGLVVLQKEIDDYIAENLESFEFAEVLLAYLSINYLGGDELLLKNIRFKIINEINVREAYTDNYAYITSKNRVYFGGGSCLTAAWFLEVTKDWNDGD
jgi:hypothetical protein